MPGGFRRLGHSRLGGEKPDWSLQLVSRKAASPDLRTPVPSAKIQMCWSFGNRRASARGVGSMICCGIMREEGERDSDSEHVMLGVLPSCSQPADVPHL